MEILPTWLSNLHFTSRWGLLLENSSYGSFFVIFGHGVKKILKFWPLIVFFQVELSKLYVSIKTISEQIFFEKILFFNDKAGTLIGFFPAFWHNFFTSVVKSAIFISRGTVWGKTLFKSNYKLFIIFGKWAENFWFSLKFFPVRSS